ncbi:MAG TPA: antitoxin Xre/MbcA/ParS toxin-binding domain-containing protein [Longimicrobiaceae bacterium]|nr:antitoxin Xre/MbcA/ParS toxin-binding domain-containing protein [Longimicrobiaceae bacterium]
MAVPAVAKLFAEDPGMPDRIRSDLEWIRAVQSGLPVSTVDTMIDELGFTVTEVEQLVLPRRTLAHRRARKQPLTRDESVRLARVARVALIALDTFGNSAKAYAWLRRPNRALQGGVPIDILDTDDGARMVEQVLGRLAHGLFS